MYDLPNNSSSSERCSSLMVSMLEPWGILPYMSYIGMRGPNGMVFNCFGHK